MSSSAARQHWREKRTEIVEQFCRHNSFKLEYLNQGYQLRIEGVMDVYPTNGRWCWLPTGERGGWHNDRDLRRLLIEKLDWELKPKKPEDGIALRADGYIKPRPPMLPLQPKTNERNTMDKLTSGHLAVIGVVLFIIAGATELFIVGLLAVAVWLFALHRWFTKERKGR